MKFQNKYLAVIAYANGYTLWNYRDLKTTIEEINDEYFGSIDHICAVGDKIMLVLQDGYYEVIITEVAQKKVVVKQIVGLKYQQKEENNE